MKFWSVRIDKKVEKTITDPFRILAHIAAVLLTNLIFIKSVHINLGRICSNIGFSNLKFWIRVSGVRHSTVEFEESNLVEFLGYKFLDYKHHHFLPKNDIFMAFIHQIEVLYYFCVKFDQSRPKRPVLGLLNSSQIRNSSELSS